MKLLFDTINAILTTHNIMKKQTFHTFILLVLTLGLTACSTVERAQYAAWEKVGVHKRDILVERIQDTAQVQEETKQQFKSAYDELASIVNVDHKGLEPQYKRVAEAYEKSEDSSERLKEHITSVNRVAIALFTEWQQELGQYTNTNLRKSSADNLALTKKQYAALYKAMKDAYKTIEPVLSVLRDNQLYLKHNLNANAINGLQTEVKSIEGKVQQLIKEMEGSIKQSQQFIRNMKASR